MSSRSSAQEIDVPYDLPQTTLQFAYPGVDRNKPEFFAAYLMNHILGGGDFSSRLFDEVREKRGLAYSVSSRPGELRSRQRLLVISTATRSDRAAETHQGDPRRGEAHGRQGRDGGGAGGRQEIHHRRLCHQQSGFLRRRSPATLVGLQVDGLGIDYIQRRVDLINNVTLDQVQGGGAQAACRSSRR